MSEILALWPYVINFRGNGEGMGFMVMRLLLWGQDFLGFGRGGDGFCK